MNNVERLFEPMEQADIFAALYNEYYPKIFKYTLYRVGDHYTAEDLVSEVFEKVLLKYDTYNPQKGKFGTWLFTIVNNTVINHHKKTRPVELKMDKIDSQYHLEDLLFEQELKENLLKSIMQLNERQKDVIALKFGARLNNREIAQVLEMSESNVGTILYRSLKQLRDILKEQEAVY